MAPNAGHDKSIPELRAGIRDYEPVHDALSTACRQVVAGIASPTAPVSEADVRRKASGWVTDKGPRVWAAVAPDLKSLRVALLKAGGDARATLAASVAAESDATRDELPMSVGDLDEGAGLFGPCVTLALTGQNWQSAELVPALVRIVRRAAL